MICKFQFFKVLVIEIDRDIVNLVVYEQIDVGYLVLHFNIEN